jgi:hypothetical protein
VNNYMFNNRIELHSVGADLWVYFGLAGLLLAVLMGIAAVRMLLDRILGESRNPAVIFLSLGALWDLLFSPFASNFAAVATAVAVAIGAEIRSRKNVRRSDCDSPSSLMLVRRGTVQS